MRVCTFVSMCVYLDQDEPLQSVACGRPGRGRGQGRRGWCRGQSHIFETVDIGI